MFHICDYFETNRYICLPKMRATERKLGVPLCLRCSDIGKMRIFERERGMEFGKMGMVITMKCACCMRSVPYPRTNENIKQQ